PHASFTETSDRLERSETLLLYTDGLVERPGEIIDAGLDRLLDTAREPDIEAGALCDRLLAALVPSGGARDDVAVLALENPAPAPAFEIVVPPEPESLVWVRQHLRRWLTDAGADERELFEVTLACDEACTNAVEHAHSQHGDVAVSGSLRGAVVEVTIGDAGRWRPAKAESDQGRGLTMMRELMDGVEVATGGDGSVVTLRRALSSLGAVEPVA
ncbi:MAG TPA: ATP-binding protein, partial [Thermoleophilaceae bacterium]|nr:ATP-binding protein [Thermoleophilaceae bacterium]